MYYKHLSLFLGAHIQAGLPAAQVGIFCNLLRWSDYLQHTADRQGIFERVRFEKPRLIKPPPPPVASASKAQPQDAGGATGVCASIFMRWNWPK